MQSAQETVGAPVGGGPATELGVIIKLPTVTACVHTGREARDVRENSISVECGSPCKRPHRDSFSKVRKFKGFVTLPHRIRAGKHPACAVKDPFDEGTKFVVETVAVSLQVH